MPKSILKSILVSIDRSSDSTPAMELCLRWAKRFEAELVGVGFIDEYGIEVCAGVPLQGGTDRRASTRR